MAEACADIYAAIARLEAKIDSIPKTDEKQIIAKTLASVFQDNRWLEVGSAVAGIGVVINSNKSNIANLEKTFLGKTNVLGNTLDSLRSGYNGLGEKVNSAVNTANRSRIATDSLGRTVVDQSNRMTQFKFFLDGVDRKTNGLLGKVQQFTSKADGFLSKLSPLFNVLGVVGAIAGVAALAGTLGVVFPRLDAHDRELDAQRQATADAQSTAIQGVNIARAANSRVDQANRRIQQVDDKAEGAGKVASLAIDQANEGIKLANASTTKANLANAKADTAISKADGVNTRLTRELASVYQRIERLQKEFFDTLFQFVAYFQNIIVKNFEEFDYFIVIHGQRLAGLDNEVANLKQGFRATLDSINQTVGSFNSKLNGLSQSVNSALREIDRKILNSQTIKELNARLDSSQQKNATVLKTVVSANATSQQALNNSLKIYEPRIFNQQFRNSGIVQPLSIEQARAEIKRTVERDYKLDPRAVKPLTLEQARVEFKRTVERDFKFDPNAVKPVAIQAARAEVKQRFQEIKQTNQNQLQKLGSQITNVTQTVQQQITNFIIPPATAAEPAALERAITQSPTVNQLKTDVSQLKTNQGNTQTVNEQAIVKLDQINQKIDQVNAKTTTGNQLMGNIQEVIKGIERLVNGFTDKINNLVAQVNASINDINTLINQLNTFITSVNEKLRELLNYAIAALAILTILRPLIVTLGVNTVNILGRLTNLASWLKLDRVWNMLTYAAVLHNAFMLSNSFGQTLLTATSSFLNAFVIGDSENNPIDVQAVLGKQIEDTLKAIFGDKTVAYFNNLYKANIRTYQAAANILSSVTSMAYSILTVLEVVGSRISRIGNALRWFGVVADNAFSRMNEVDIFSNPFIVRVTKLEEAASTIDMVSNEVISVKQEATNIKKQKTEFDNSLKATAKLIGKEETIDDKSVKTPIVNDADIL